MKKFGKVAIVGAPNAGKSTLINKLMEEKISIVSPKAQTTRNNLRGIFIKDDTQILLIDTPGLMSPRTKLEKLIVKNAWTGIRDADYLIVIIDATDTSFDRIDHVIDYLKQNNIGASIVINKIDLIRRSRLLEIIDKFNSYGIFEEFFLISAKTGEKVDELVKFLVDKMPEDEWLYNEEDLTDAPIRYMLSEITREQLYLNLERELPYAATVETEKLEHFNNKSIKVNQSIYVMKQGQKNIVIGKQGSMIKQIGAAARYEMKKFMKTDIHLFLFVKINENWVDIPDSMI